MRKRWVLLAVGCGLGLSVVQAHELRKADALSCHVYFAPMPAFEWTASGKDEAEVRSKADAYMKLRPELKSAQAKPSYVLICDRSPLLLPGAKEEVFTGMCTGDEALPWLKIEASCRAQSDAGQKLAACAKQAALGRCRAGGRQKCGVVSEPRFALELEAQDVCDGKGCRTIEKADPPALKCRAYVDAL